MNKPSLILLFLLIISFSKAAEKIRERVTFDYDWKFIQSDVQNGQKPDFDDKSWRKINVPHDWSIECEFDKDATTTGFGGFLPTGIGWYRKQFNIARIDKDKKYWIEFDGVYMNSEVWINGSYLGKHPYGYTAFYYDLTPYLKNGKNTIAVKVDNSVQSNSRWYSGSGIYRHVWLNIASNIHVAQWGTYITTPDVDSTFATVKVNTTIENYKKEKKNLVLKSVIKNELGEIVSTMETPISMSTAEKTQLDQKLEVIMPQLWSTETPTLYTLESYLLNGTKVVDNYTTTFGIRKIEFDTNKGFFLNGKHVKMNGVCLHHDGGCVGAAVPDQVWIRRFKLLKEMGCNAIRTSHNPASQEFLDLCDKMGFLVMAEAFDEWEYKKDQTTNAYHKYFAENWKSDLLSMIYRDRNHPSIVIWSAGNEVPDQSYDNGIATMRNMLEVFHREDPTRPVTQANDMIASHYKPAKTEFLELQDIVGYNYVNRWGERRELYYSIDNAAHPNWKVIGTENASASMSRGVYRIPEKNNPNQYINYISSLIQVEELWRFTAINDYVIGDFMWTGIDFLGESHRWPTKHSTPGMLDLCGFPKDGYYFYQSQWTTKPMVHIMPHWNWKGHEGQVLPVIAFSNCDSAELYLNGRSFGMKTKAFPQQGHFGNWQKYAKPFVRPTTSDLHFTWDVPYESGTIKIVGKKGGTTIIQEVSTTGNPASIRLTADKTTLNADAQDASSIKVEIIDSQGRVVPEANNKIEFSIVGEGEIIGTDNGNPTDLTMMQSKVRNAFNGLALAVVRSTLKSGNVKLTARSAGLSDTEIILTSQK